jgi:hypothetical protein
VQPFNNRSPKGARLKPGDVRQIEARRIKPAANEAKHGVGLCLMPPPNQPATTNHKPQLKQQIWKLMNLSDDSGEIVIVDAESKICRVQTIIIY